MVRTSTALLKRAKELYWVSMGAQHAVYYRKTDRESYVPAMIAARDEINVILGKFDLPTHRKPESDYGGLRCEIEGGYDRISDRVSDDRRKVREAKIHVDRAAIDAMRPASAHIDRPIRPRQTYKLPPKPPVDTTVKTVPDHVISLDAAIVAIRAIVETLPDDTRLPESTLNATYIRLSRRRTPQDPAPVTENDRIAAQYGLIDYMPRRVTTVGDLKAFSHEELIGLPRVGRQKVLTELAKLAREHNLDAPFADDRARVAPANPVNRVLHALALGLTVARVRHDSHTGRSHHCMRAYEIANDTLVESPRTAAYNETDGHVVGMGNVCWHQEDVITWSKLGGVSIASLTEKGAERARQLLAA